MSLRTPSGEHKKLDRLCVHIYIPILQWLMAADIATEYCNAFQKKCLNMKLFHKLVKKIQISVTKD